MINNFANYNEFRFFYDSLLKEDGEYKSRMRYLSGKAKDGTISSEYYFLETQRYETFKTYMQKFSKIENDIFHKNLTNRRIIEIILWYINRKEEDNINDSYRVRIVNSHNVFDMSMKNIGSKNSFSKIFLVKNSIFDNELYEILSDSEKINKAINYGSIMLIDTISHQINTQAELKEYLSKNTLDLDSTGLTIGIRDEIREGLFQDYKKAYNINKSKTRKKK